MTFKNESQLKNFLMSKCTNAVANTEKKVYEELSGSINQFYTEFKPKEYIRTGALFNSLDSTGVVIDGNCVTAEVRVNTPSYTHGFVPLQSGDFGYSYWDDEYILSVTMKSGFPHGGYEGGTAIWTDSMDKLGGNDGIKNLLKQELKKQGL